MERICMSVYSWEAVRTWIFAGAITTLSLLLLSLASHLALLCGRNTRDVLSRGLSSRPARRAKNIKFVRYESVCARICENRPRCVTFTYKFTSLADALANNNRVLRCGIRKRGTSSYEWPRCGQSLADIEC